MSTPTIPAAPAPPPAPAPPRNGLGVAALVLGIIGAIFALIPVVGAFFAIPLAILAVTFGAVGYVRVRKGKATNKGVTISGLVLGVAAFVFAIVMAVMAAVAVDQALSGSSGAAPQPAAGAPAAADDKAKTVGIGDKVSSGDLELTVTQVRTTNEVSDDSGFITETARGKYVIVHITVANTGDDSLDFWAGSVPLIDSNGNKHDSTADVALVMGESDLMEPVNPGSTAKGFIAYDVPESANVKQSHIEVSGGFLDEPVQVNLR